MSAPAANDFDLLRAMTLETEQIDWARAAARMAEQGQSPITIRLAQAADAAALAAADAEVEASPWTAKSFESAVAAGWPVVLAASSEDDRDGFALWAAFMPVLDEMELLLIGVRPERQRRGLAKRFLSAVFEEARSGGFSRAHLEVRASNAPAQALYAKLGFEVCGRRRNYYPCADGGREDAVLMDCVLAGAVVRGPAG